MQRSRLEMNRLPLTYQLLRDQTESWNSFKEVKTTNFKAVKFTVNRPSSEQLLKRTFYYSLPNFRFEQVV